MLRKVLSVSLFSFLALSVFFTGCSSPQNTQTTNQTSSESQSDTNNQKKQEPVQSNKPIVGFIFSAPVGDGGWAYSHNLGRKALEEKLGVKTIYRESVSEDNNDSEQIMRDMIKEGATIIFATSFNYMDHMEKVSKEYPQVKFMHCSGYKSSANMSNYFGRMEQAKYLAGMVAGLKTKTNKIGYLDPKEIPETVRLTNAFALGVQATNPNAKLIVKWTNSWFDPQKEKMLSTELVDSGIDVLTQGADSTAAMTVAKDKNIFYIGTNTDSISTADQKSYLTSAVWNWAPYYIKQVQAVIDGTWKSESYFGSINDDIIKLSPFSTSVSKEIQDKVLAAEKKIKDGSLKVFAGPLKDQSGKLRVAENVEMTDKEILSFDWFVNGIDGTLGNK